MLVGKRVVLSTLRECDLDQHLFAIVRGEHRPPAFLLADRQQEGGGEAGHGC